MLLWFAGTALAAVWLVFKDPAVDHRLVVLGALLPDVIDAPWGGARVAHAVVFPVALLTVVMLATRGRRHLRRSLVMLAVGVFLHLVFDGVAGDTRVFWWPFSGAALPDAPLPSVERGWINVPLEVVGLALCAWAWRRFGLSDPSRRRAFARTGRIDRSLV
jgi:hypothetical protein